MKKKKRKSRGKSEIRVVSRSKNPPSRRAKKRLRAMYRRRRILLSVSLLVMILIPSVFIYKKVTAYGRTGYPAFREEVLEDLATRAIVSDTKGRSLTTSEKLADFDKVYDTVLANFAVTNANKENYLDFEKSYEEYRKRTLNSKTDQEFFEILTDLMGKLGDDSSFILDKSSYDSLFDHYKNMKDTNKSKVLGADQVVDRYNRMIGKENNPSTMSLDTSNQGLLIIKLPNFAANNFDKDLEEIMNTITSKEINSIVFDLSDNKSIDFIYTNKILTYFIDQDYNDEKLYFYRGNIFQNTLEDIKNIKDSTYQTALASNLAVKYENPSDKFDKNDFMYYDKVSLNLKKDTSLKKRALYVLTNDNTANEAIRFAYLLKEKADAHLTKNALETEATSRELVKFMPADLFCLDHSGLIISLNTSIEEGDPTYLTYDHRINSDKPYRAIIDLVE